jgi:hypothetical protein
MTAVLRMMLVLGICLVPCVVVLILISRERRFRRSQSKAPFKELRRRPAGEAIRVKLAEFDDKISELSMWLVLPPALVAMSALIFPSFSWVLVLFIVFSLIWTAIIGFKVRRNIRERGNYHLGFDGERFVGEELNSLVARQFEVYHDVPFDGFNIDHVLVGPPGVFSVETKTRRKPIDETGKKEYHIEFDGDCLCWPWGTDTDGLDQAARNARTLSQWLSGAVGESVLVTAILTLPGWMVERKAAPKGVHVLNPKEIVKLVDRQTQNLNENLIKRICYQLEQKCKMEVE